MGDSLAPFSYIRSQGGWRGGAGVSLRGLWGRAPDTAYPSSLASSARPGISLNKTDGISLQMSYLGKAGVGDGVLLSLSQGLGRAGTGHTSPS